MKGFQSSWAWALVFLFNSCASPPKNGARSGDSTPRVVVLHVSDLHARIQGVPGYGPGYARVAAKLDQAAEGWGDRTDILRIFGGDAMGKGSMICRESRERACVPLLQPFGFQVGVLGNWELKRSVQELRPLLRASGFPWIGTNLSVTSGQAPWMSSFRFQGPKSGADWTLVGWTAAPTPGEIDFKKAGYRVTSQAGAVQIRDWVKSYSGRDLLWVTHSELEDDQALMNSVCGQSAFRSLAVLRAHTHVSKRRSESSCGTPMMEAGAYGLAISQLVFEQVQSQWTLVSHEFLDVSDDAPEQPQLRDAVAQLLAASPSGASDVVAEAKVLVSREGLAQWLSKAFVGVTRADIGIANLGAVKDPLQVGSISRELLLSYILPYNDPLVGADVDRRLLERALCQARKRTRDDFEDNGSELFMTGAKLVDDPERGCRLEGVRGSSVKLAMPQFVAKRSARWLGLDLSRQVFAFGVDQNHAVLTALKKNRELP